ncbi:hypothetical protein GDO86_014657 [Hymenochirus boettgeri]|uniref:GTP-binding protein n=1 Tax=Hymenochirus boettgeri TaxID=247094 RepID=A0A8T2JSI3_9PIPI|nr:hypothetical protein GDO86_014657 [Hymenochirus boettgeri]
MCAAQAPLRRRASTPLPYAYQNRQIGKLPTASSYVLGPRGSGSSESGVSEGASNILFKVVLLGDPGVGKSCLAAIFREDQEKESSEHQQQEVYECTLTVDGEDTTLLVVDTGESEAQKPNGSCDSPMRLGNAYIIVYSVTDRASFESASELRIQLRRTRQAENIPIILVGNKADLVRSREVSVEEGRACAVVFDCKFIETSAVLQLNVQELFEGMVRQIRLRREGTDTTDGFQARNQRKKSLSKRAHRFLDRLVARNSKTVLNVHSRSCHDLSVL